jgi:hypothetical protein
MAGHGYVIPTRFPGQGPQFRLSIRGTSISLKEIGIFAIAAWLVMMIASYSAGGWIHWLRDLLSTGMSVRWVLLSLLLATAISGVRILVSLNRAVRNTFENGISDSEHDRAAVLSDALPAAQVLPSKRP